MSDGHANATRPADPVTGNSITLNFEPYDTEILAIEKVINLINRKYGEKRADLENFRREVVGRFEEINMKVSVLTWETNVEGMFLFEIQVEGRIEDKPFDYDRQVHEVTHDVLGLGEGGVIH